MPKSFASATKAAKSVPAKEAPKASKAPRGVAKHRTPKRTWNPEDFSFEITGFTVTEATVVGGALVETKRYTVEVPPKEETVAAPGSPLWHPTTPNYTPVSPNAEPVEEPVEEPVPQPSSPAYHPPQSPEYNPDEPPSPLGPPLPQLKFTPPRKREVWNGVSYE